MSRLEFSVVRSEKLETEAGDSSATQRKGTSAVGAATMQRLVKSEDTLCVL
jgi:hypothetical protein